VDDYCYNGIMKKEEKMTEAVVRKNIYPGPSSPSWTW